MSAVDPHTHPGLEDRITAEITGLHTDLVELRAETRRGFTAVVQALEGQGETLRQILARLPGPDGNGSAA